MNPIQKFFGSAKSRLFDRLRYSPALQLLKAKSLRLRSAFANNSARLDKIAHALRIELGAGRIPKLAPQLRSSFESKDGGPNIWFRERIGWDAIPERPIDRSLVLKVPQSPQEKGVLMVWFESNLVNLLRSKNIATILRDYHLIFASSWSPPTFQTLWPLVHFPGAELSLMLSNPKDDAWFKECVPGANILPFYMSSWIDPSDFTPKTRAEKDIDLLMVANWAPFKRHWALFEALRSMPQETRVVLVGQPDSGRTVETIQDLAKSFGVTQNITYHNRLPVSEVNRLQERSHTSIILSKREGSCVVIAESMMADAAVGILEDAHIGSSAFINAETGRLLREKSLGKDLTKLIADAKSGTFSPREWAESQISCHVSNQQMNDRFKAGAKASGKPWTKDLAPFVCRGVPRYLNKEDESTVPTVAQIGISEDGNHL